MKTHPVLPGGKERAEDMTVLGYIFLAILAVSAAALVALIVVSLPDIRRYLAIRRM